MSNKIKTNLMPTLFNDDLSISKDSVFDWGSIKSGGSGGRTGVSALASAEAEGRTATARLNRENSNGNGKVSRYDPKGLARITDINDLVDDSCSDDENDVDAVLGSNAGIDVETGRRGGVMGGSGFSTSPLCCRQATILLAITAIIAAASLAIGLAVTNNDTNGGGNGPNRAPYSPVPQNGGGEGAVMQEPEQHLLEIAERVVLACDQNKLNDDISECQSLCHSSMCCFEDEDYSCKDDASRDCAVYAGCQALLEGIPTDGLEEEEG